MLGAEVRRCGGALCAALILLVANTAAAQSTDPAAASSHPAPSHLASWHPRTVAPSPRFAALLADQSPAASSIARAVGSSEWVVGAGAARSIGLFQSKSGRRYLVQTVSWGRELTRDHGPGALRGRFAWAMEVMPVFRQLQPARAYGLGVAPVLWRWNFVPRRRWSGFGELAMGGLWSSTTIPEGTSRVNFTAHWGGGVRVGTASGRSLVLAYRFQHISNGNQLSSNPGINSHVALVGWSMARQK